MRKFNSGHRTRVSVVLALTVLVVAATAYGLGATESWRGTLAVALAAGALLALSWILVGVLRQKEERIHHRTLHDPLSNLPNRSKFVDRVYDALDRAAQRSRSIAVLVVDLDDFDEINHSLGYEAGDRLLAVVGERLEAAVRSGDTVARLCSDEFAVLLEDVTDQRSAVYAAKQIEDVPLRGSRTPDNWIRSGSWAASSDRATTSRARSRARRCRRS